VKRQRQNNTHASGAHAGFSQKSRRANAKLAQGAKAARIILTVAHKDELPENSSLDNLAHWCQRCHHRYDASTRQAGIAQRRSIR